MADWYVSSAAYAAVPQWAATTAYTVGQFVRKLAAPTQAQYWVFRCTTAGTSGASEPAWNTTNNSTTASGGAVFTNVAGQSAYGWSAAAGTLFTLSYSGNNTTVPGDRIFVSSDHSETLASPTNFAFGGVSVVFGSTRVVSVNRAGSVPPVAADVLPGAAVSVTSGNLIFESLCMQYYEGITFTYAGTTFWFNNGSYRSFYFKNCAFVLTSATAYKVGTGNNAAKVTWDHTTIQFGGTGQRIGATFPFEFTWLNTPSAIQGATIPARLFEGSINAASLFTCRGVDLSALTGILMANNTVAATSDKVLLDSCRVAPGLTRYGTPGTSSTANAEVELVNCFDGTNYLNERYTAAGAVTTDRSTTLSGGAQDDVGAYSLKLVSNANADKYVLPLEGFWMDVENALVGSARTAAIEVVSSGSLNNDDIRLLLEYMGTGGSAVASFADSLASVLTASAALPSSSSTWSPIPATTFDGTPSAGVVMSNGNLTVTHGTTSNLTGVQSTTALSSGKYYFEATVQVSTSDVNGVGVRTYAGGAYTDTGGTFAGGAGVAVAAANSLVYANGSSTGKNLGATAVGDVIGCAFDLTARLAWIRRNGGNWNADGTANPTTGVGGVTVPAGDMAPLVRFTNGAATDRFTANFGATTFAFTAPSGFAGWYAANKQLLQVAFTPQAAGRVRGLVRLGKVFATMWVNPQIVIT